MADPSAAREAGLPSPIALLHLASKTAYEARLPGHGDPMLLLAAARLERMAGVVDGPALHEASSRIPPQRAAAPPPGPPTSGLLDFDALLQQASALAADEAPVVAAVTRALRAEPPAPVRVRRWSGRLAARTEVEFVLAAPAVSGPAEIALAWAGSVDGELWLLAEDGHYVLTPCDRGGAQAAAWSDGGALRIRIVNPGRSPAEYALSRGWMHDRA